MEYYLSDQNLEKDRFFNKELVKHSDGYMDIKLILKCVGRNAGLPCLYQTDVSRRMKEVQVRTFLFRSRHTSLGR